MKSEKEIRKAFSKEKGFRKEGLCRHCQHLKVFHHVTGCTRYIGLLFGDTFIYTGTCGCKEWVLDDE